MRRMIRFWDPAATLRQRLPVAVIFILNHPLQVGMSASLPSGMLASIGLRREWRSFWLKNSHIIARIRVCVKLSTSGEHHLDGRFTPEFSDFWSVLKTFIYPPE
jgi:hypothetical protein